MLWVIPLCILLCAYLILVYYQVHKVKYPEGTELILSEDGWIDWRDLTDPYIIPSNTDLRVAGRNILKEHYDKEVPLHNIVVDTSVPGEIKEKYSLRSLLGIDAEIGISPNRIYDSFMNDNRLLVFAPHLEKINQEITRMLKVRYNKLAPFDLGEFRDAYCYLDEEMTKLLEDNQITVKNNRLSLLCSSSEFDSLVHRLKHLQHGEILSRY